MNEINRFCSLKLKVGALFDHALHELDHTKNVTRSAAQAGYAAMGDFVQGMQGQGLNAPRNIGIAIIRCAEKPVDDRLKLAR